MRLKQIPALLARVVIRAYQVVLSPFIGNQCRFHPTCSNYALEAVDQYGAVRGSWMALRRIGRCHPFNPGGLDPVPARDPEGQSSPGNLHPLTGKQSMHTQTRHRGEEPQGTATVSAH